MTTIHAKQIQLTKIHVKKTQKVLYIVSNIFSHHIAFYELLWAQCFQALIKVDVRIRRHAIMKFPQRGNHNCVGKVVA